MLKYRIIKISRMSLAYRIGFPTQPEQSDLDRFMQEHGFKETKYSRRRKSSRIYIWDGDAVAREIHFRYENRPTSMLRRDIEASGNLVTYAADPTVLPEERLRLIAEGIIRTELDWMVHITPERRKFYETACAFKTQYGAIVVSEPGGQEINPHGIVNLII